MALIGVVYLIIGIAMAIGLIRYLLARPWYPRPPTVWVWPLCVIAWPIVAVGFVSGWLSWRR